MTRREQEIEWIRQDKYNNAPPKAAFLRDLKRLESGEPVDYIIGFVWFLRCKVDLQYKPLIPRPESEYWAAKAITEAKERNRCVRVLDMFSGSGCVGLAFAKNCNCTVDFADLDKNCLRQIKKNLKINNLKGRVICSDIFKQIKKKYDFIVANPPYIPRKNLAKLNRSVRDFEPHKALVSGKTGLEAIRKFLCSVHKYLAPEGIFYFEFDSWQNKAVRQIAKSNPNIILEILRDQYGKIRYARGHLKG